MLKSLQPTSFLPTTTCNLHPLPSTLRSSPFLMMAIPCQIEAKTHLVKSTIGRIKKEINVDKENRKGGHPSKLSYLDKQSIIFQITTGKLDNAVQATHFINNNTLPNPITPQPVRNALKENNVCSVIKKKKPPPQEGSSISPSEVFPIP